MFVRDGVNCPKLARLRTAFQGALGTALLATPAHPTDIILRAMIQNTFEDICAL